MLKAEKILVVVFKNIGDVLLASPVFTALKRAIAGVKVHALVNGGTEEMLTFNPDIDKVHVLNRKALKGVVPKLREEFRVLRAVRSERYDAVICLTPGDRGRMITLLSGAGTRIGPEPRKKGLIPYLTVPVRMAPSGRHYVERNLDCLRAVGIFPDKKTSHTAFFVDEGSVARTRRLLEKAGLGAGTPYMVTHPTSRWMFKCWPHEKAAALIDRVQEELKLPVVLTSGPDESERAYIRSLKGCLTTEVVDLTGILSLKELGAVVRGGRLFFGVDSAPMHISAAVGTPVVALFGPSSVTDWAPWGEGHRVITSKRYDCLPCGRDGCNGTKVSDCLVEISVETVFKAVKAALGENVSVQAHPLGHGNGDAGRP